MLGKATTVVASEEPESRGDNILRTAGVNATLSAPRHWSLALCRQRQEELILAVLSFETADLHYTQYLAGKRSDAMVRYLGPPSPKHSKQRDGVSLCAEKTTNRALLLLFTFNKCWLKIASTQPVRCGTVTQISPRPAWKKQRPQDPQSFPDCCCYVATAGRQRLRGPAAETLTGMPPSPTIG
jgi:hypothetical protein